MSLSLQPSGRAPGDYIAHRPSASQKMLSSSSVSTLPFKTDTGAALWHSSLVDFVLLKNYQENPPQPLKFRQETKEHKRGIISLLCNKYHFVSVLYVGHF